jgi:hypothetical protein
MSALRWLGSPLAGTAGVLAALGVLAVPLHQLTSSPSAPPPASGTASVTGSPAVLRVKLLAPAARLVIRENDGNVLLDLSQPPAGESEHDAVLQFTRGGLDLTLSADFGDMAAETAVFLTVMPDGHEEQTLYVTGSGLLEESLHYEWHHAH